MVCAFVLDRSAAAGGKCDGKKEETHPDEGIDPAMALMELSSRRAVPMTEVGWLAG